MLVMIRFICIISFLKHLGDITKNVPLTDSSFGLPVKCCVKSHKAMDFMSSNSRDGNAVKICEHFLKSTEEGNLKLHFLHCFKRKHTADSLRHFP